jgi:hypothetical protein
MGALIGEDAGIGSPPSGGKASETSILIRTKQRHIPEDGNIHNYRCENLKSYITFGLISESLCGGG